MTPQTLSLLKERLAAAPPEIVSLINSGEINRLVTKLQSDFSLTEIQATKLSNEVVLTVLFFEPTTTLTQRIIEFVKVDNEVAKKIYGSLYQTIFTPHKDIYDEFVNIQKDDSHPAIPEITNDIAETEAALSAITPIRTMNQDMVQSQDADETTHSSTQAAILKEGQPTTKQDAAPRWGEVSK